MLACLNNLLLQLGYVTTETSIDLMTVVAYEGLPSLQRFLVRMIWQSSVYIKLKLHDNMFGCSTMAF